MLLTVPKRCNIRFKWRGWQKEWIREVMIRQLWIQHTLSMLHFEEQLFALLCSAKYAHYLLYMGDKVKEACGLKRNWGYNKQETQILNLLNTKDQWIPLAVEIIFTNPSARAGYDTRSIFKWSLTGLNSEFSFSYLSQRY